MSRSKSRFWARGCGRNPANLGIKWQKETKRERNKGILAERPSLRGTEVLIEIAIGNGSKKVWMEYKKAVLLASVMDAVRNWEWEENNELPHLTPEQREEIEGRY